MKRKEFKKRRYRLTAVITVVCLLAILGAAVPISRLHRPGLENAPASEKITDISAYVKRITLDMNANLPPDEILNMGGSGLQLYDADGSYIDGDKVLDCTNAITVFLRVVWLENYAADCSLLLLADNHVQTFQIDEENFGRELLTVTMQPRSSLSIPVTLQVTGDAAVPDSTLTFLLLSYDMKKSDTGTGDALQYPNSTNSLSYKIKTDRKKEYSSETENASQYGKQTGQNEEFIKSKAFYSVLSAKKENAFPFYQEDPVLHVRNNDFAFYAMGEGGGSTFFFIGDRLMSGFDGKPYLSYSLDEKNYLAQKVDFDLSALTEGDRLTILSLQQSSPPCFHVTCHKLSLTD